MQNKQQEEHEQKEEEHSTSSSSISRRTKSINPILHQPFLVVDGLQWDLSNLSIDSLQQEQAPADPASLAARGGSIIVVSSHLDGPGENPSSPSEIPASSCLDQVDGSLLDKHSTSTPGARLLNQQGCLANPQLADDHTTTTKNTSTSSRDTTNTTKRASQEEMLRISETPARPFESRMATSARTAPGNGNGNGASVLQRPPSPRKSSSRMLLERQEESDDDEDYDPMEEEMIRRDESYFRREAGRQQQYQQQDQQHSSRRQPNENIRANDPFQRMDEYRNRMRSRQDEDDCHPQSRRDDTRYQDRPSRTATATSSSSSNRRDDNYRPRKYVDYDYDYDRSNDHTNNNNNRNASSRDSRYRRDADGQRSSSFADNYPSPRSQQQQEYGRNQRQGDSRHRGAREDSSYNDTRGYRRQEEDYHHHHRTGGSGRDEYRRRPHHHQQHHDSRRSALRDDCNARRYDNEEQHQHQQQQDDYIRDDQTLVEVTPGHVVPLRGSLETWAAIQIGRIQRTQCLICTWRLVCVEDAAMVLCPGCRYISPVEGGGDGGLGLGMRDEDARMERNRVEGGTSGRVPVRGL